MSVTHETDEQMEERFYQAVLRKLAELAEEFPEIEAEGRKIDPKSLFEIGTPEDRARWEESRREHEELMARANAVIDRIENERTHDGNA